MFHFFDTEDRRRIRSDFHPRVPSETYFTMVPYWPNNDQLAAEEPVIVERHPPPPHMFL